MSNNDYRGLKEGVRKVGKRLSDISSENNLEGGSGLISGEPDEPAILHVFGQDAWHDPVTIAGDERALRLLRAQIDQALSEGVSVNDGCDYFQNDGEGFILSVIKVREDEADSLATSYSGEFATPKKGSVHPDVLIRRIRS